MEFDNSQIVTINYINYRNEKSVRKIIPKRLWFGSNKYHQQDQWLLDAFDIDKQALRSFALKDISRWQ